MYCTLVIMKEGEFGSIVKTALFTSPLELDWLAEKLNDLHAPELPPDVYFDVLYSNKFENYGRDAVVSYISDYVIENYL